MNITHFWHAAIAAAGQLAVGLPLQWMGWKYAVAWMGAVMVWGFVMREHAHRQNDIADTTYVPVPKQNPLDGFRGWSRDARLDVIFPLVTCVVLGVLLAN